MGCHTDTVLLGSTKNIRNAQRRATMEPLSTPALMLTEALVRLRVHRVLLLISRKVARVRVQAAPEPVSGPLDDPRAASFSLDCVLWWPSSRPWCEIGITVGQTGPGLQLQLLLSTVHLLSGTGAVLLTGQAHRGMMGNHSRKISAMSGRCWRTAAEDLSSMNRKSSCENEFLIYFHESEHLSNFYPYSRSHLQSGLLWLCADLNTKWTAAENEVSG